MHTVFGTAYIGLKMTKHKTAFNNLSLNGNSEGVKCIVDFKSPRRYDEPSASALHRWSNSIYNPTIKNVVVERVTLWKTRLGDVLLCLRYCCCRGRIYRLRQQQVCRGRIDGLLSIPVPQRNNFCQLWVGKLKVFFTSLSEILLPLLLYCIGCCRSCPHSEICIAEIVQQIS